ncbi:uncharacterized protein LOC108103336 [Drosophila eugracilis]|uniref:uncharacterized protein LOC108103336 n=1 Tax=Drosophila eugracilis TaxID=29029 RepID=UPI001BDAF9E3|nr:uncharacterized protein LOC108103336 [Drosophila eugracilis]
MHLGGNGSTAATYNGRKLSTGSSPCRLLLVLLLNADADAVGFTDTNVTAAQDTMECLAYLPTKYSLLRCCFLGFRVDFPLFIRLHMLVIEDFHIWLTYYTPINMDAHDAHDDLLLIKETCQPGNLILLPKFQELESSITIQALDNYQV